MKEEIMSENVFLSCKQPHKYKVLFLINDPLKARSVGGKKNGTYIGTFLIDSIPAFCPYPMKIGKGKDAEDKITRLSLPCRSPEIFLTVTLRTYFLCATFAEQFLSLVIQSLRFRNRQDRICLLSEVRPRASYLTSKPYLLTCEMWGISSSVLWGCWLVSSCTVANFSIYVGGTLKHPWHLCSTKSPFIHTIMMALFLKIEQIKHIQPTFKDSILVLLSGPSLQAVRATHSRVKGVGHPVSQSRGLVPWTCSLTRQKDLGVLRIPYLGHCGHWGHMSPLPAVFSISQCSGSWPLVLTSHRVTAALKPHLPQLWLLLGHTWCAHGPCLTLEGFQWGKEDHLCLDSGLPCPPLHSDSLLMA